MYQRIMNKLDVDIWSRTVKGEIDDVIINRVKEQIEVLDNAYGSHRGKNDMGGYILFFSDSKAYENSVDEIVDFYNIDKDLFEYSDCIFEDSKRRCKWIEKLYLLGSDDAIVLFYPKEM